MRPWANAMQHRACHAFGSAVAEIPQSKSVLFILRLHTHPFHAGHALQYADPSSAIVVLAHADMRCQDVECWCAGIPEDALLDELDALLPASALRLLSVLEREGLLSMRSAAQPAPRIPWILMRHNQAAEPSGKVSTPILSAVSLQRLHGLCSTLPENINLHQSGLASPLVGAGCAPLLPSRG